MTNDEILLSLLERARSRFYGKYRGTVTDVEEGGRGRIKAKVPAVLGDQKTGWCSPCLPYAGKDVGIVFLPEVGSGVWIEFEGGDVSLPIWSGCYFRDDELPAEAAPGKKVIRTRAGHQIVLDDDGETITLSDPSGNTITLSSSGISLARSSGTVEIAEGKVTINGGAMEVT